MSTQWLSTMKPAFRDEWMALPSKEVYQIHEKIKLLEQDPTPDAKVKKQLKYMHGRLHRLRSGKYRIFYTFQYPYISLLALRKRDNDTYDEELDVEFLGGLDPDLTESSSQQNSYAPDWEKLLAAHEARKLPEPITTELLNNLRVPPACHKRLLRVQNEDELLACPGVPDEFLLRIHEYLFERPLIQVLQQPDFVLQDVDDLLRFKEGELLGFLLKLSPEQEKYINWAINASGPTLLKGGPGTGKSTIALYRVRSLINDLRKRGQSDFRILFTTYTKALVSASREQLRQLLGSDIKYVEVQTADSIAMQILAHAHVSPTILDASEEQQIFRQALQDAQFDGNALQQQAQRRVIERLNVEYLQQEINQVILARQIKTLDEYLVAARPGRRLPLNALQRRAVWSVYQAFVRPLAQTGKMTWRHIRTQAAYHAALGKVAQCYDAVLIDEAQDLDPSALRMLVHLCAAPNRLFITADANQSIYGSGFNWTDVHESLRFQGRTAVLQTNYRSTREIGEAAQSYLSQGVLDSEAIERVYINSGSAIPAVRAVRTDRDELQLLARFLPGAAHTFGLGLGACAILCPTAKAGKALAARLSDQGIEATFMTGQQLRLSQPGVKVLTLSSAKGLEFPIVALAGFSALNWYSNSLAEASEEERTEILAKDRRRIFVGMTRAMRALLVIVPARHDSPLLTGFDPTYWNIGG